MNVRRAVQKLRCKDKEKRQSKLRNNPSSERPPAAPKTDMILFLVKYVVKPDFNASGRYKKVPKTQCFRDFLV